MKKMKIMAWFLLMIVAVAATPCRAQTAQVGKITYVEGRVDLTRPGAEKAELAKEYVPVSVGDFVRTKSGSKAEIVFDDASIVRLAENSRIEIADYKLDADKRRRSALIKLNRGKARATVAKMPTPSDFIIKTPNAEAVTDYSDAVAFYQAGSSGMVAQDGSLSVYNQAHPDKSIKLAAGFAVLVPLENAPTEPRSILPVEMKLHEKDTVIPQSVAKRDSLNVLRGSVTKVSGEVRITLKNASKAHPAQINEVIGEGDRIETGADGAVSIVFGNGNAIFLKPDTNILITRLISDPKTGEYENLFVSDKGKIKALIEKIGGKSKFEIKTPTAVCGARGTIMYLTVSARSTSVFFEGGHGYMNSQITNDSSSVGAGEQSTSDSSGSVTDPSPVSESERMDLDESWNAEGGTGDGSTSGEGGTFMEGTFGSTDGSTAGSGEGGTGSTDEEAGGSATGEFGSGDGVGGSGDSTFVDVPITETGTTFTETSTTVVNQVLKVGTLFASTLTGGRDGDAVLQGGSGIYDLTFDVDFNAVWGPSAGPTPFAIGGSYETGGAGTCHIWTADGIHSRCPVTGEYITPDGGSFFGFVGAANSGASMIGLFTTLYISPSGDAGVLMGHMSGLNGEAFTLSGSDLQPISSHTLTPPVAPGELYYSVSNVGYFTASGHCSDPLTIYAFIQDGTAIEIGMSDGSYAGWGMWATRIAGSHVSPLPGNWSVPVSGLTIGDRGYDGSLIAEIAVGGCVSGLFPGTLRGIVLNVNAYGGSAYMTSSQISGDIVGSYVDAGEGETGTWQALGAGEWVDVGQLAINAETTIGSIDALIASAPPGGFAITDALTGLQVRDMVTPTPGFLGVDGAVQVNVMDMNFYSVAGSPATEGIWAAIIQGVYTSPTMPGEAWSVTVSNPAGAEAVLTGTQWSGGTWSALVTGTAPNGANTVTFQGSAAGTYVEGQGAQPFSGAGTGNWTSTDGGSLA